VEPEKFFFFLKQSNKILKMTLFRSETMGFYHLILPTESSWEILNELGRLSLVHFVDLNGSLSAVNRPFTNYIKRCDEILLKMDQIKKQMKSFEV